MLGGDGGSGEERGGGVGNGGKEGVGMSEPRGGYAARPNWVVLGGAG